MSIEPPDVADAFLGGSYVTIRLGGEIDLASRDAVSAALLACPTDTLELRVDLAQVTFIDVTGVAVLLAAANNLERRGGSLTLEQPHPRIRRILSLLGAAHLVAD